MCNYLVLDEKFFLRAHVFSNYVLVLFGIWFEMQLCDLFVNKPQLLLQTHVRFPLQSPYQLTDKWKVFVFG